MQRNSLVRTFCALAVVAGLASATASALAQQANPLPAPSAAPPPNGATVPAPQSGVRAPGDAGTPSGPASASGTVGAGGAMASGMTDADFVRMAATGNNAEIDAARYMARNSTSPVVRMFAQRMIDDHTTANVELLSAVRASKGQYDVPLRAVPPGARDMLANYAALSGKKLDGAYMRDQLKAHNEMYGVMAAEALKGKEPVLRSYAQTQQAAVQYHLQMAYAYDATRGASTAMDAAGVNYGGFGTGVNTPPVSQNGTPALNPAVTGNGTSSGTSNGSGGVAAGNPNNNNQGQPTLSKATPAPGTQPANAGSGSTGGSGSPGVSGNAAPSPAPTK